MADCCAQLQAEIAALKIEVSKLGKVDEESIITKAFNKSKDYLEPIIGGVSTVAIAAGVKATSAFNLGEIASIKAGSAFSAATAAGKVAQAAQVVSLEAEFAATAAASEATAATVTSRAAAVVAAGAEATAATAAAFAASALGKAVLAIANVLALAGSIAGLFSLYATLQVVFPRLDAHDRELDSQQSQISKNSNNIYAAQQAIKKAQGTADDATAIAQRATDSAYEANTKLKILTPQVEEVTGRVSRVEPKVEDVTNRVKVLTPQVEEVTGRVSRVEPKVEDVTNRVKILTPQVEEAINRLSQIEPKVEDVSVKVRVLTPQVEDAQKSADEAFSTAITIKPIALDALKETQELRPISEQALTDANLSLTKIKVVEPIANDALKATQLQGTQLQATKLEVTKLGTVSNNHGKQIELNTKDISNLKTADKQIQEKIAAPPSPTIKQPDTSKQDQMNDKALQDLQRTVGLVTISLAGITALLKPISQNTSPQALANATAAGTCKTAQPGGCMSNMVNNSVGNAADNINKNTNNVLNAANAAANTAQLGFLQDIQKGVNLANTKLGPLLNGANGISGFLGRLSTSLGVDRAISLITLAANLHNAMMLSANLKITLLEMLSSVGNATGLLQTPEGENVDLNKVFDAGIEKFLISILGIDSYAGLKVGLRKYNAIYQAATNSLNAVSSMFNAIGNVIEQGAENTGRIGNALKGAGAVAENAYQWMAEKFDAKSNKFIKFQTTISDVTQVLETVNEIAETVVEGQQAATEFQKANTDFIKAVEDAKKVNGIENKAVKAEADKAKENATKDPTGEIETGLFSFLTN